MDKIKEYIENYTAENKVINIDSSLWSKLIYTSNKEEVINFLFQLIRKNNLSLPIREITENQAVRSFDKLKKLNIYDLIKYDDFDFKVDYIFNNKLFYLSNNITCNNASNYFNLKNRMNTKHKDFLTPSEVFYDDKKLLSFLNGFFTLKFDKVNTSSFYSLFNMRSSYVPAQFPVSVARAIYIIFKAKNILDFSAGWGDRLAGFSSCKFTQSYTGIDPNKKVYDNYYKQVELYNTDKQYNFINMPAEDVELKENSFDLIFTSPPYFNAELYDDGDDSNKQSHKRYNNLDLWLNGFLFATLKNCINSLKENGYLLVNISDVLDKKKRLYICDPLVDFVISNGLLYCGCVGLKLSKRANANYDDVGILCEPILIFKNGNSFSLSELNLSGKKKLF